MSERDEMDPIAESLRRQFAPPALDELMARVAAAARELEESESEFEAEPGAHAIVVPLEPVGGASTTEEPAARGGGSRSWRVTLGVAAVFGLAAALVLLLRPPTPDAVLDPPGSAPRAELEVDSARYLAGAQLDRFLISPLSRLNLPRGLSRRTGTQRQRNRCGCSRNH